MFMTEEIKDTLDRLENLMYGYNYEVSFGIDIFENCRTLEDFYSQLKLTYKDLKPETSQLVSFTETGFWEEVDFGFAFRGDSDAGLTLSAEKDEALRQEQTKFKDYVQRFLSDKTKIYSYPGEEGIPFYVVYWGYAFILLNDDKPSLFVFAAASD